MAKNICSLLVYIIQIKLNYIEIYQNNEFAINIICINI